MSHSVVFTASMWLWPGEKAAWHFLTVPVEKADEIRFFTAPLHGKRRPGFGAIKVQAHIGNSTWETSIFPNREDKTYLLPVKATVRKSEGIGVGDEVRVRLKIKTA